MTIDKFNQITKFLWEHREFYKHFYEDYLPDYPDYACLPPCLIRSLSSEAVDALQEIWVDFVHEESEIKTYKKFQSIYKEAIQDLGEKVK